MKIIFLLSILMMLISCKDGTNKTSAAQNLSAYQQKPFLVIAHSNDTSIAREKLLHFKLNALTEQKTNITIEEKDKFNLKSESFEPSIREQIEYQKLKSSSAEIVISYTDRIEIYFVPTGISREKVFQNLNLQEEQGKKLEWGEYTPSLLSAGQTYYILSYTKADLLSNDQKLFQTKISLSDDVSKIYQFSSNQKIIINFNVEYFFPDTEIDSIFLTQGRSCKWEMEEAGMCAPCTAKMERVNGNYHKEKWSLSELEIHLTLNGSDYSAKEMKGEVNDNGLNLALDLSGFQKNNEINLQFVSLVLHSQKKTVTSFSMEGSCRGVPSRQAVLDLTPKAYMKYEMLILGRKLKL